MTPPKYNESALDILFKNITEKFDSVHKKLDEILDQTTLHNGRMSKLELWRSYITGGLAVIIMLLVPVVISLLTSIAKAQ